MKTAEVFEWGCRKIRELPNVLVSFRFPFGFPLKPAQNGFPKNRKTQIMLEKKSQDGRRPVYRV